MRRRTSRAVLVTTAVVLALPLVAGPASAASGPQTLATGLAGPLQLAVGNHGAVYVGENFAGRLTSILRTGETRTVTTAPDGAEIAGVDASNPDTLVYTTTTGVSETTVATASALMQVGPGGHTQQLADLFAYEQRHNPDHINRYGFSHLAEGCTPDPTGLGIPGDVYKGLLDTHPYAVAIVPGGWVVADAAGNDLIKVSPNGAIRTLAVLPPQPVAVTEQLADEIGSSCAVGSTFKAEPVPTDVEMGPDGMLYVSTLSGGPAPGSVYRVNPGSGAVTLLATGFAGATNLAVAPDGTIYVAELFGGQISKVVGRHSQTVLEVPFPAAVEWADGKLYASTEVFSGFGADGPIPGDGKVISFAPRRLAPAAG